MSNPKDTMDRFSPLMNILYEISQCSENRGSKDEDPYHRLPKIR